MCTLKPNMRKTCTHMRGRDLSTCDGHGHRWKEHARAAELPCPLRQPLRDVLCLWSRSFYPMRRPKRCRSWASISSAKRHSEHVDVHIKIHRWSGHEMGGSRVGVRVARMVRVCRCCDVCCFCGEEDFDPPETFVLLPLLLVFCCLFAKCR